MPKTTNDPLSQLVQDILASPKYRDINPDLITAIGARELSKRRTLKEAIKATRNKLHQVGGAYFASSQDYAIWLHQLVGAPFMGPQEGGMAPADVTGLVPIQQSCRSIMAHHASTRERLPILDQFYATVLADLPPIHSVLDLACGLNPLALPWMPLAADARYYAYDIYQPMLDFLNLAFPLLNIDGHAQSRDITQSPPDQYADLALILKTIPCLEQIDKQAGSRLLHAVNVRHILVSFPVHSLGGKSKGMSTYYEAHFRDLLGNAPWEVKKFEFATELAFLVQKGSIY
jgi:16S rRNA (guanine(1405)-N(7))-methyltransferase